MPTINNEPVLIGDRVYDITQGHGTVIDLLFGDIIVRFDSGLRMTFDKRGYYSGVRRLYWHDPIVFEPVKTPQEWSVLSEILRTLAAYLKGK